MENITASFRNPLDMEKAAQALLKQGVILLKQDSPALNAEGRLPAVTSMGETGITIEAPFILQAVVESSRRRQAEDTIRSYGGEY